MMSVKEKILRVVLLALCLGRLASTAQAVCYIDTGKDERDNPCQITIDSPLSPQLAAEPTPPPDPANPRPKQDPVGASLSAGPQLINEAKDLLGSGPGGSSVVADGTNLSNGGIAGVNSTAAPGATGAAGSGASQGASAASWTWGTGLGTVAGVVGMIASSYGLWSSLQSGDKLGAALAAAGLVLSTALAASSAATASATVAGALAATPVLGSMGASLGAILGVSAATGVGIIIGVIIVIIMVIVSLLLGGHKKHKPNRLGNGDPTIPNLLAAFPKPSVILLTTGVAITGLGFHTGPNAPDFQYLQPGAESMSDLQSRVQGDSGIGSVNPKSDVFYKKGQGENPGFAEIVDQSIAGDAVEVYKLDPNGKPYSPYAPNLVYIPFYSSRDQSGGVYNMTPDAQSALYVNQPKLLALAQFQGAAPRDQEAAVNLAAASDKHVFLNARRAGR